VADARFYPSVRHYFKKNAFQGFFIRNRQNNRFFSPRKTSNKLPKRLNFGGSNELQQRRKSEAA